MVTSLANRLSLLLPKDLRFHIHHVVGQTTTCESLFAPPPASKPDYTSQEPHTLSVSINHEGALLQLFALEAILYETDSLTTLFVSKADSTGYGYLQENRHPSITKVVVIEFLKYVIESRKGGGIKFVVSLFARAQDQYLFPGSIENAQKHVLDDRRLIKWWCKILDQVLKKNGSQSTTASKRQDSATISEGFLKVPGCDDREVQSFFPKHTSSDQESIWTHGDPLKSLQPLSDLPERCLIPRFPDDPKARFAIDLDDELPENRIAGSEDVEEKQKSEVRENGNLPISKNPPTAEFSPSSQPDPPKPHSDGKWRSVRSLDQFWELMGFRQECAAGRLVGFIWGVIDSLPSPPIYHPNGASLPLIEQDSEATFGGEQIDLAFDGLASPPLSSQIQPENDIQDHGGSAKEPVATMEVLESSLLTPSSSQVQQAPNVHVPDWQVRTQIAQSDELLLLSPAYDALSQVLQTGDYSTLAFAKANTSKWVETLEKGICVLGGEESVEKSRTAVVGQKEMVANEAGNVRNGLHVGEPAAKRQREGESEVKTLAGGLVRKKRKVQS